MSDKLILGSRGSQLALWQTEWVKAMLEKTFPKLHVEIRLIKTKGDKILDSPLSKIGDKGLFTREIEQAMLDNQIDAAVHSLKDLPTQLPEGLCIGAIGKREDARDVFIANTKKGYKRFEELSGGATIATSSLRRKSQLLHARPDLNIVDVRGNLNTRLAKLDESDWDGMILARAGVIRLGFDNRITETLSFEQMLPAVGQGALAVEIRENDHRIEEYFQPLNSQPTNISTCGERALLRYLEGGCQIPIGAYGRIEDNVFQLDALIGSIDGKKIVRGKIHGKPEESEPLGKSLAKSLLECGGKEILDSIRTTEDGH
ncbi:MAG: hydroxymethylbilane synthase [Bacteroidetes bacterium]|nr:MAG: hydroxymethylbilane synthase [Bacteroidota bacterium]